MKIIIKITRMLAIATILILSSCDENEFLKEEPLAIYAADNTLVTVSDFQAAVNMLYRRPGDIFIYLFHSRWLFCALSWHRFGILYGCFR